MRLLVIAVLLAHGRSAAAGPELAARETLMLDGAIGIRLPERMKPVANQQDYGLALPAAVATRAELTLSNGAVHAVARQTFTNVSGDFRRAVIAELALQDLVGITRTIDLADGVKAIAVDPPAPRRGDQHDLIHAIYVHDELHHTVFSISFYASGGAYDDIDTWVQLAQQATATTRFRWAAAPAAYWMPVQFTLGPTTLELELVADWAAVPIAGDAAGGPAKAVVAFQRGALGKPGAVCGVDYGRLEAPAGANPVRVSFLGVQGTARSWSVGSRGHAELAAGNGDRVWCRVRGGKPDDAVAALRTITAATHRYPPTTTPVTPSRSGKEPF